MSIVDRVQVWAGNITELPADLLVLKYAGTYYGADAAVASATRSTSSPRLGSFDIIAGAGIAAAEVAFLGVGELYDFRYPQIRDFGAETLRIAAEERPTASVIGTTIHGVGYGLDERESFLSHLWGFATSPFASRERPERIIFADRSAARAERLNFFLEESRDALLAAESRTAGGSSRTADRANAASGDMERYESFGTNSESKSKLFVAMPYSEKYEDEFKIGFEEAAHPLDYICESLKYETFTGDVLAEIERRIRTARGMIALLNDSNPNVFFEVGYAMALGKPIVFVCREGVEVPFDVRNQQRVVYKGIGDLREKMRTTISGLASQGVL